MVKLNSHRGPCGQARIVLLGAVLVAGIAGGVLVSRLAFVRREVPPAASSAILSDSTRQALEDLRGPVEVRYYSILDLAEVPARTKAFADRVDQLLSAYERESNGKIRVVRHTAREDAGAAAKDGLRAIAAEDRDAAYLGVALSRAGARELIPQLAPEWEGALEPDLTRAIQRLSEAPAAIAASPQDIPDSELLADARRRVPQLENLSLEDGKKLLKQAALVEFKTAVEEGQARIRQAQEQFVTAQSSGSHVDREQALRQLQALQAEQNEKLQEIAARSEERIAAFERLKKQ